MFIDTLPNPDIVGETVYRAVHEALVETVESMPEDDQREITSDLANDLREIATMLDNAVKNDDKE